MRHIFAIFLSLALCACASPIASVQSRYQIGRSGSDISAPVLNICRPTSSEHFYKSVGMTINGDAVGEIGPGERYEIASAVDGSYRLGFYPPETNMLIKMLGREKAFGVIVNQKTEGVYVILSTDNLMLSLEQEKTDVIKNYYESSIYPWQVRTVSKALFMQLCGEIKQIYLSKKLPNN